MPQDPFPSPPGDEQEPDGFPLHADEEPGPDEEGMAQGLYVCLPAGQLTLAGFCQGGASDTMAPGALLATVVEAVAGEDGAGLAGCSDDQLLGIISAARRLESRAAWTLMAATGEFARRAGTGLEGEFAADELASELHMSKVKNETVANLSSLPDHVIDLIDAGLKGSALVPAAEAVTITRSLPHGHAAAAAMAAKLGLPALLGPAGRQRDLALALIISRVVAPASKLSTLTWRADTTLGADLGVADASTDGIYAAMDWLAGQQDAIEA